MSPMEKAYGITKITTLAESDIEEMVDAFKAIDWDKPKNIFENYLAEQINSVRSIFIVKINNCFCGFITIKWNSSYLNFKKNNIPEIADLNVLPKYQRQGIGSKLIKECEKLALEKEYLKIGLGVGLLLDYGNAQRLYFRLGYIPDGNGLFYKDKLVNYNEKVLVDDNLLLYLTKNLI